jgi:aspartate/methionine/tyrosine aminotransferase
MKEPFSKRTPDDFEPNRFTERLEAAKGDRRPVINLTVTNPTQVGFEYPELELREIFARALSSRYEPDPRGLLSAREAIATSFGNNWNPEHLWLTASTSEAYSFLTKLLAEPGDEILIPSPSYPLFEPILALEGVKNVSYPLTFGDAWNIDTEVLSSRISNRTRALIAVHPNNPTGSFVKQKEFQQMQEYSLPIISDEVFAAFPLDPAVSPMTASAAVPSALTFTLGGFSKLLGLPQLKLSWIYVSGPADQIKKITSRLDWICDTYLSVSGPVQAAVPELIRTAKPITDQILNRIRENNSWLQSRCSEKVLGNEGGWSAILKLLEGTTDEVLAETLLERHAVLVQPGYFFDLPFEGIVVSLLPSPKEFRQGIERFLEITA